MDRECSLYQHCCTRVSIACTVVPVHGVVTRGLRDKLRINNVLHCCWLPIVMNPVNNGEKYISFSDSPFLIRYHRQV